MKSFRSEILRKELFWFSLFGVGSFLIWCTLALIANQDVIADDCLYDKERIGFLVSVAFFYLMRISSGMKNAG